MAVQIPYPSNRKNNFVRLNQDAHQTLFQFFLVKVKTNVLDGISEKISLIIEELLVMLVQENDSISWISEGRMDSSILASELNLVLLLRS